MDLNKIAKEIRDILQKFKFKYYQNEEKITDISDDSTSKVQYEFLIYFLDLIYFVEF